MSTRGPSEVRTNQFEVDGFLLVFVGGGGSGEWIKLKAEGDARKSEEVIVRNTEKWCRVDSCCRTPAGIQSETSSEAFPRDLRSMLALHTRDPTVTSTSDPHRGGRFEFSSVTQLLTISQFSDKYNAAISADAKG